MAQEKFVTFFDLLFQSEKMRTNIVKGYLL